MSKILDISIVTVSCGDIEGLWKTLESIDSQTRSPCLSVVVASGYSHEEKNKIFHCFDSSNRIFLFDQDSSLYNAMNIGLRYCTGDFVFFLNGGDIFFESTSLEEVSNTAEAGLCNVYRTSQTVKGIRFCRPKIKRMELLEKFPGHQGFFAPLPLASSVKFDESLSISADHYWMRDLIFKSGVRLNRSVVSQFSLGGVSNHPTIKTIKLRFHQEGLVSALKELSKWSMFLVFGSTLSYFLIYYNKYDFDINCRSKS